MKLIKTLSIITLCSTAGLAQAQDRTAQHVGVGAGSVLGALVAGPVGLAVGATFGNFIGIDLIKQDQLETAESHVQQAETELASVQRQIAQKQRELAAIEAKFEQQNQQVIALKGLVQEVPMAMLFDTKSAELAQEYQPQLKALSNASQSFDDLQIHVLGHADSRGDTKTNQALSEARASVVSDELIQQGTPETAIQWVGYGEEKATGRNAKDRRVELRLDFGVPRSALFSSK